MKPPYYYTIKSEYGQDHPREYRRQMFVSICNHPEFGDTTYKLWKAFAKEHPEDELVNDLEGLLND